MDVHPGFSPYMYNYIDLFKSLSEKTQKLSIICRYEYSEVREDSFSFPVLEFAQSHRHIIVNLYFISDDDLNKSNNYTMRLHKLECELLYHRITFLIYF